jgi:hypothetical protein
MPEAFMSLCPKEFDVMREQKIKLLRLSNPYLSPAEEDTKPPQSNEDQMNMITIANTMMGGQ